MLDNYTHDQKSYGWPSKLMKGREESLWMTETDNYLS